MKNKAPEVSIAIPKAKPKPSQMARVSPGVYRNNEGALVRSRDGQQGQASVPHKLPGKLNEGSSLTDTFRNYVESRPLPKAGGLRTSDDLMAAISRMLGGNQGPALRPDNPLLSGGPAIPIPKRPMTDIDPGLGEASPQIPSSNSITDLLRRR